MTAITNGDGEPKMGKEERFGFGFPGRWGAPTDLPGSNLVQELEFVK
jgi:hypothetical protein